MVVVMGVTTGVKLWRMNKIELTSLSSSHQTPSQNKNLTQRLQLTKPSWVVRTESNVRREKIRKPDPPCVVCKGNGRINCHDCRGRGRTNCSDLEMLPKGEWPKWCKTCGGSGLGYCNRCLGTGEYRDVMGFQFMKLKSNRNQNQESDIQSHTQNRTTVADFYEQ